MQLHLSQKIQRKKLKNLFAKKKLSRLNYGSFGLKILESGLVTPNHLETIRRTIVRVTGRKGRIWFRVKPLINITSKPLESRMGKGKGLVKTQVFKVRAGTVLLEVEGVSFQKSIEALNKAKIKLPMLSRLILV